MANTYTIYSTGISFASNKSLISIFNATGSGRILRIYKIYATNVQTSAVTGVLTSLEITRTTGQSSGSASTVVKHDTNNESFPAQITCVTNATDTSPTLIRRLLFCTEEVSAAVAPTIDELWAFLPLSEIWQSGYADTGIQPLVVRETEGIAVRQPGSNTVGTIDLFVLATLDSS